MIGWAESRLRRLRRFAGRSEWGARLLGLPHSEVDATRPGLLLVQIDGLSRRELRRALDAGHVPFLRRLVDEEGYGLHPLYAGVPSTTPCFQGELFYGVRQAVPAFSFADRASGRIVRMYEREPVAEIERGMAGGPGLLAGGSAYCDVFVGGASDARFCMASMGWGDLTRAAHPLALPLLALLHLPALGRAAALLGREVVAALAGLVRGLGGGQDLRSELQFVWKRVAICVLLREIVTVGAEIDLARGLPIVHLDLLGYDEYAHRRGPSSLVAHRSLRGIDRAIGRLAAAAHRSGRRVYDVWIYSDHGQEETISYVERYGLPIRQRVAEVFHDLGWGVQDLDEPALGVQTQRVRAFGDALLRRLVPGMDSSIRWMRPASVVVTAQGPLGHVYCPRPLSAGERDRAADALVHAARVPLVLSAAGLDAAKAWTERGTFLLPRDGGELLGGEHPYREVVAADLVELCRHPNAGDFVISGWRRDGEPLSFPHENGAHGGPGPCETDAFVLLPADTELHAEEGRPWRAGDLRAAALSALGRVDRPWRGSSRALRRRKGGLRLMTYNVHSCVGMDGKVSPERIARVIARYDPDVVALQELDVGRQRTQGVDQAAVIAEYLQMIFHFQPTVSLEEEQYGDAILSRVPMRLVRAGALPRHPVRHDLEPRGAIWVSLEVDGAVFQVVNTHLSLNARERRLQAQALLGAEWLGDPRFRGHRVLCGDFNALPGFPLHRALSRTLRDCQVGREQHRPRRTWFSRYPIGRIDHIFVDADLRVDHVEVPSTVLTRVASDHLPLLADLVSQRVVFR